MSFVFPLARNARANDSSTMTYVNNVNNCFVFRVPFLQKFSGKINFNKRSVIQVYLNGKLYNSGKINAKTLWVGQNVKYGYANIPFSYIGTSTQSKSRTYSIKLTYYDTNNITYHANGNVTTKRYTPALG